MQGGVKQSPKRREIWECRKAADTNLETRLEELGVGQLAGAVWGSVSLDMSGRLGGSRFFLRLFPYVSFFKTEFFVLLPIGSHSGEM